LLQHFSAADGYFEVVKILVKAGVDVNSISDESKTPLDLVINRSDRAQTKAYLLAHGAMTAKEKLSPQLYGPALKKYR
jgi:hypothetical protein